ncbi:hypothetical protein NEOLEDRAFT_1177351 [Neolentinus lepideus HHB14362 ss-1]|uniref:Uncharacterized protein n=1 Tax=Neolentinus lepideus HHB14362 ss-1 TaxID=1314782 RepID=A0A165TJQ1_9AGAM|nr:hypothetical protein NEOLEDRAFT_1177351 [Neolentinus lepideus HHB14362 ss-1]
MIYGSTNTYHRPFVVSIDNGPLDTHNGIAAAFRVQNLLYYGGGLPSGNHTATVTNVSPGYLDLDFVVASDWTTPAPPGSQTSSTSSPSSSSSTPVGAIAGGAVGVAVLVLIALALWLWSRRSTKRRRQVVDLMAEGERKPENQGLDPLEGFEVSLFLPPSRNSEAAGHSFADRPVSSSSIGTGPVSSRFREIAEYQQPPPGYDQITSAQPNLTPKEAKAARMMKQATQSS